MVVIIHSSICDSFAVPPSGGWFRVNAIEWNRSLLPPEGGTTNFFRRINLQRGDDLLLADEFFDRANLVLRRLVGQVGDIEQERLDVVEQFFSPRILFVLGAASEQPVFTQQLSRQSFLVCQVNVCGALLTGRVPERTQKQLRKHQMLARFRVSKSRIPGRLRSPGNGDCWRRFCPIRRLDPTWLWFNVISYVSAARLPQLLWFVPVRPLL